MARALNILLLVLLALGIQSCVKERESNSYRGEAVFIVEPQCKAETEKYLKDLNSKKGFKAELKNFSVSKEVFSDIEHYAQIKSKFLSNDEFEPYMHGAMANCSMNAWEEYELNNREDIKVAVYSIADYIENNNNKPVYLKLNGSKLKIYSRSGQ